MLDFSVLLHLILDYIFQSVYHTLANILLSNIRGMEDPHLSAGLQYWDKIEVKYYIIQPILVRLSPIAESQEATL